MPFRCDVNEMLSVFWRRFLYVYVRLNSHLDHLRLLSFPEEL